MNLTRKRNQCKKRNKREKKREKKRKKEREREKKKEDGVGGGREKVSLFSFPISFVFDGPGLFAY